MGEMESDFIEISGEDDSLLPLPKVPNDDVSSLSKTFFSCSPLHLPRSDRPVKPPVFYRTPGVKLIGNEDKEKLDSSAHRDGVNKDNINLNKSELPKLNMEPQQMKRKKKGGGYNLRKSLAWDRAFFTEEGVLDPLELSMISGNFGKSSGEMLPVIHEDRRESLSRDSENLVAPEENLFKELPSSSTNEDRKSNVAFLPKNAPLPGVNVGSTSAAKRKVFSVNDINRSGSKRSGCTRPFASPSLKRPANLNTSNAATKETKVSKIPVPKPDASMISAIAKSTILCTSNLKKNQIAQRAVNAQRNIGIKGSLNNSKIAQNIAKSASKSMAAKSSVQPARRNVVSSVSKIRSTNSQHPLVTKANNGLKINPAPELPASGHASNNVDGGSSKFGNALPQNIQRSAGSVQYAQQQTAKPSGLRMPSPSLSFFNQTKTSASNNLLHRSNQTCNPASNISKLKKFGVLNTINERSIPTPGKIADMVNHVAPSPNLRLPGSITGSSVPSNVKLDPHEKMKSNLQGNDVQKVCMEVTSNCNSSDILKLQRLHNPCNDFEQQSGQHAEPSKNEKISHVRDNELLSNDNKLLLQSAPDDQVKEDENNERVANVYPMSTDLSGAELKNPDCMSRLFPTRQVDGVFEIRDVIKSNCVEEKKEDENNERVANVYPMSTDLSGAELKNPDCMSRLFPTRQVDGVFEIRDVIKSNCVEEKMCNSSIKNHVVFSESLHVKSCMPDVNEQSKEQSDKNEPSTCQVGQISNASQRPWIHNDTLSKESVYFSEFQQCNNVLIGDGNPEAKCCSVSELESSHGPFQSKNTEEDKDSVAGVDTFSTKSPVGDVEVQSVGGMPSVGSRNYILCSPALHNQHLMVGDDSSEVIIDADRSRSKCSSIPSSILPDMEDCSFDTAKTAECLPGDDALSGSIDAQCSNDIKLHVQPTSGESEMMSEDQIMAAVTTGDIHLPNVPDSGDFSGCELENLQHLTAQHSAMVQPEVNNVIAELQVNGGSDIKDINEHKDVEGKQHDISQNNHCCNFDLLPGDDTACHQQSTSVVHNDRLTFMQSVNNQSEGNELLFNESIIFEKSRKVDTGNIADTSPDVKNSSGRQSESSHVLFQHEHTEQFNEDIAGTDNTIKKLLAEDAQLQALDGNLLVHSCDCNLNTSAEKNMSSVCVDGVHEQSGEHSDPDPVSAQGSLDSHPFCVNGRLTTNNFYSKASQERNVCGSVMDVESRSSIVWTQVVPALKNGGIVEEQEPDYPTEVSDSIDIKTSVENPKSHTNTKFRHDDDDEFNHAYSVGFDASLEMSDGQISGGEKSCNYKENQTLSSIQNIGLNILNRDVLPEEVKRSDDSLNCKMQHKLEDGMHATEDKDACVFKDMDFNECKSDVLHVEAEATTSQTSGGPNSDMKNDLEDSTCAADENDEKKLLKNSWNDKEKNDLVIKPPPSAVPFSDEWLAAFEAAGEEILTKKSGAVQNSPPDKSLPEPGPWSPVKRKNNQEIGPFDCTKYTNANANANILPSDSN